MLVLSVLVLSVLLLGVPTEVFAEGKLQINPDTDALIQTGETVTEKIVGSVQKLADRLARISTFPGKHPEKGYYPL